MLTEMSRRILSCALVLALAAGGIASAAPVIRVFAADRGRQLSRGVVVPIVELDANTVALVLTVRGITYEEWSDYRSKMAVVHDGFRYPEMVRLFPQRASSSTDEPPISDFGSRTGFFQVAFLVPKDVTEFTLEYRDAAPVRFKASRHIEPFVPQEPSR